MKIRSGFSIYVLVVALLVSNACIIARAAMEGSFDRTLNVSGSVDLDVTTGSGKIRVRTGDNGAVHIYGLIRAHDDLRARAEDKVRYLQSNPPIEQSGNIIRIGRIPDYQYRNVSISYELVVPADTRLRSKTGSGEQSIEGIKGPAEVGTGSGNISISSVGVEVTARTGSGRIDLDSINGRVEAHTGSGNIQASRIAGSLKADTGSGGITAVLAAAGDVDLSTGSGKLEASGIKGSLHARTGSGHITAGGEPSGEWNVHASSGGITLHL
ncbi:MAG TPA: DUF4097 family beta strand repeat-containing protein, partial [Acidobacteriota bacterium]|nr:DUF4097 family beta strand repeat-containing protein [Acidobacteriota bacterium]